MNIIRTAMISEFSPCLVDLGGALNTAVTFGDLYQRSFLCSQRVDALDFCFGAAGCARAHADTHELHKRQLA